MKNLFLFILLLSTLQGFSQKKGKMSPEEIAIDSLTKETVMLSAHLDSVTAAGNASALALDSVTAVLAKYQGMYATIKEKVVMHDFDPGEMGDIIDSLRAGRDSTFQGLSAISNTLSDSIATLNKENSTLKAAVTTLQTADADKDKLVTELKQLKELLDSGIINQEEFDAKKTILMAKWE